MGMSDDFYRGVIVALEIITVHDDQIIFDEIAQLVGVERLVRVARRDGEMRRSGLTKYGYSHYGQRPNTASSGRKKRAAQA
jgi:hypothetical protein